MRDEERVKEPETDGKEKSELLTLFPSFIFFFRKFLKYARTIYFV